ncbi:hypothetical protein OUZ56_010855 [Daphnia magna]|uniref:Uncharacterized protein n=1 Tax=Daphnia magna TaxID=35525 RepID=A0ABQ9YZ65_9CRUS|nr:hypothetical protein OUZ56_010855 [Daphnia magna]
MLRRMRNQERGLTLATGNWMRKCLERFTNCGQLILIFSRRLGIRSWTRFVSWKPQPGALASNAFTLNWEKWATLDRPALVVVVTGALLRPTTAPAIGALAADPTPHPLQRTGGLLLAAWKLSGDVIACKDFRRKWSSFSWTDSAPALSRLMNRHGAIGCVGAWRVVKIPCRLI